jgi:hypothetical protein
MAEAYASAIIPADATDVWRVVCEFNGLPDWHPGITGSVIEDDRQPTEVGCIRRLTLADGGEAREQLVAIDDTARSYTYDILTSPFAIRSYRATIRLAPVTATGQTFAAWWTRFDADATDEPQLITLFAEDVFAAGLRALSDHFDG